MLKIRQRDLALYLKLFNALFFRKGYGNSSPPHFVHDCQRKIFLMSYSIYYLSKFHCLIKSHKVTRKKSCTSVHSAVFNKFIQQVTKAE